MVITVEIYLMCEIRLLDLDLKLERNADHSFPELKITSSYYLIFSTNCPKCKNVKFTIKQNREKQIPTNMYHICLISDNKIIKICDNQFIVSDINIQSHWMLFFIFPCMSSYGE